MEEPMEVHDTPARETDWGNTRDNSALLKHVFDSYYWLRFGMAITAFLFPPLLWAWGKLLFDLQLQGSMSAYYWAPPPRQEVIPQCGSGSWASFSLSARS